MIESIPTDWRDVLLDRLEAIDLDALDRFAARVRLGGGVYPATGQEFEALRLTRVADVRAVILGQDPYGRPNQAHGLAFSTLDANWPPSLRNILGEWHADCGFDLPKSGSLEAWARHGVLLLNTALTVGPKGTTNHLREWQPLTNAILAAVAGGAERIAFLLWGAAAIDAGRRVDLGRHLVLESSHPSPLSARRYCGKAPPFCGSQPFGRANASLERPINWSLHGSAECEEVGCGGSAG